MPSAVVMKRESGMGLPPNPGNARWCADHNRYECTGNRNRGRGQCHGPAIRGIDKCRTHSGKKPQVAIAQGQAAITAWNATGNANIDYRMAVLGVLQMTWLRLGAYAELLRQQVAAEGAVIEHDSLDPDPSQDVKPQTSGLIGYRFGAAGKEGRIYAQSEEIRALVALESAERDRVVKFAKTAHDMGISDRLTSLAERWGDVVASRISRMLGDLNLTPEQQRMVPGLISVHLGSIDTEIIDTAPAVTVGNSKRGVRDGGGPTQ